MADLLQPVLVEIAAGNVDSTGASNADKLQGAAGCAVVKGGTGLIGVTLQAPNDQLAASDLVVQANPGFGSGKSPGGLTTSLSSYASGAFTILVWDQTTVPPAAIDGPVNFVVKRLYKNR